MNIFSFVDWIKKININTEKEKDNKTCVNWVVFPEPVSPTTTTTWFSRITYISYITISIALTSWANIYMFYSENSSGNNIIEGIRKPNINRETQQANKNVKLHYANA